MYKVSKEAVCFSLYLMLLIFVIFTGCSINAPIVSSQDYYGKDVLVSNQRYDNYTELKTFEYSVDKLKQLNDKLGYKDFDIITTDDTITIDGYINSRKVNSVEDALENITMVRSILGLINPKEQLRISKYIDNESYTFDQYYNGIRVYDARVTVNIDTDSKLITYTTSSVLPIETLKKVGTGYILSENKIVADTYKGKTVDEKVIWSVNKYREKPVVAYILSGDGKTLVINAHDGTYIDCWSNIMT